MMMRLVAGGVATAVLATWGVPQLTAYIQKQEAASEVATVKSTYQTELLAAGNARESAEAQAADVYEAALQSARNAYGDAIKAAHQKEQDAMVALHAKYPSAVQLADGAKAEGQQL